MAGAPTYGKFNIVIVNHLSIPLAIEYIVLFMYSIALLYSSAETESLF
jgi:hypothetical protein